MCAGCTQDYMMATPGIGTRRVTPAVCLSAGLLGITCCMLLISMPAFGQRENAAFATLPENNEAVLLGGQIQEALHAGDYRLAIELTEQLRNLPAGLVAAPASRTYYPVWRHAFRLMEQLPPEGVELYRQLYDAEVQSRFVLAQTACNIEQLWALFRGYPLSSVWPQIREELAALLLDQGAATAAVEVLREFRADATDESPECRVLMVVALAEAGARQQAETMLSAIRNDPSVAAESWQWRLNQLGRWLTGDIERDGSGITAGGVRYRPRVDLGNTWACDFAGRSGSANENTAEDLAGAAEALRCLPLQRGVLAKGNLLIVRQQGSIAAFEADTLRELWRMRENEVAPAGATRNIYFLPLQTRERAELSRRDRALLNDHIRHALSVAFDKIYSVESLPPLESASDDLGQSHTPFDGGTPRWNELVAREAGTGRILWTTRADPTHALYEVFFQDAPLATDRALIAPFVRGNDLSLAVLDPESGNLNREIPLVGPPGEYPTGGGRCIMVQDAASIYVCTGNGVIAALSRGDLSWKWAATYPSTLAERLGRLWWQPVDIRRDWNVDPPLLVDDLLIAAPVDSEDIIALNRYDGTERWRLSRREHPYLIGVMRPLGTDDRESATRAAENLVLVGGQTVTCYPAGEPDPERPRWRSAPLRITGRSVCRESCVYVPTRTGVAVLDGSTGKILFDPATTSRDTRPGATAQSTGRLGRLLKDNEPTQNLLVGPTGLYGLAPERVIKYPDASGLQKRLAELSGAGDDRRASLLGAWNDALAGNYEAALRRLETHATGSGSESAIRDRLVTYLFLSMAQSTEGGENRLGWLRHAGEMAATPEAGARMAAIIGAALEEEGEWDIALDHYLDLLTQDGEALIADPQNDARTCAAWLYAARRLGFAARHTKRGVWERVLARGNPPAGAGARYWQRLRTALQGTPEQALIEARLCLEQMPPELKARYFSWEIPDFLPSELRQWYLLERWDTHASLGQLETAAADRRDYLQFVPYGGEVEQETFRLIAPPAPGELELESRAEAIELAARKLEQASERPYVLPVTRQWKIERAELLIDDRRPYASSRNWIPLINLEQRRIELINAHKHQQPQRQIPDQVEEICGQAGSFSTSSKLRYFAPEGEPRTAWPISIADDLATAPAPGGIVGMGLGPERYAGRRLWSRPIPEWSAIPSDFGAAALTSAEGVYLSPRSERVVMLGWPDGQLMWQLDFPGVKIDRLELLDDRLIIISADRGVWLANAVYGDELIRLELDETPAHVDVTADLLVAWGRSEVVGFRGSNLSRAWERSSGPVAETQTLAEGSWIAYRLDNSSEWRLLDARQGRDAFEAALGHFETLTAAHVAGERVYVAGRSGGPQAQGEQRHLTIRALDLHSGVEAWSRSVETGVRVNPTQLSAHPDYIPILLTGAGGSRLEGVEYPLLQWISKADGRLFEPHSIRGDYRAMPESTCEVYLLATPTRIIVQIGGNVLAYGNSPLRQGQ